MTDPDVLIGKTVLHYRILKKLGEGGMGVVYRADDLKLGRQVAIKCLPGLSASESELRRFEREARTAAGLNHPHICIVHGFENLDGQPAIVMELVEGETLAARLARGPLPQAEALKLAIQIAGALAEAHRNGIVHRDLKPGNIMLTKTGAKVLDFGLAKIEQPALNGDLTLTKSSPGLIMGTVGYMAPEQAQGKESDARSDIFSFGVVLYQMFSGRRPFEGDSAVSVIAAILERDPLPFTPAPFYRLVRHCLAKDPAERWQSALDLKTNLEWLAEPESATENPQSRNRWPWVVGALLAAIAIAGWLKPGASDKTHASMAVTILPPAGLHLRDPGTQSSAPELSPDGTSIVYVADAGWYVRRLDSLDTHLIPGSATAGSLSWSPDSSMVTFASQDTRQLTKVRLPDGTTQAIAPGLGPNRGTTWSEAGTILISMAVAGGLRYAPASGGELLPVGMQRPISGALLYPQFLPGSEDFLFLARPPIRDAETADIFLATFSKGNAVNLSLLMKNQTPARFTPAGGGQLLFVRNDNLYSQKLNRRSRKLEGEPQLVASGVSSQPFLRADFSVDRNGTVAWRPGKAVEARITQCDRSGKVIATLGPPGLYGSFRLSPAGDQLISHGWLLHVGQPGRIELPKEVDWFGWRAGGSRLVGLRHVGEREVAFVEMPGNGSGEIRELAKAPPSRSEMLLADGKYVILTSNQELTSVQLDGSPEETKPVVLAKDGALIYDPSSSPDSKWIVYQDSAGGGGLFVQPFPGPGSRRQIAPAGSHPAWRADGKEIVYRVRDAVMSIAVANAAGTLAFGPPHQLFSGLRPSPVSNASSTVLAVSPDGSSIFFIQGAEQPNSNMIHIKTNAIK